jgi:hypothetical protein
MIESPHKGMLLKVVTDKMQLCTCEDVRKCTPTSICTNDYKNTRQGNTFVNVPKGSILLLVDRYLAVYENQVCYVDEVYYDDVSEVEIK